MLKDAEVLCGKQELKEPLKIVHAWFMRSYQMSLVLGVPVHQRNDILYLI